jgi:hypothetical protein
MAIGVMTMQRFAISAAAVLAFASVSQAATQPPAWAGFAGNAQHTGQAPASPQPYNRLHWSTPVDLMPLLTGDELLIHYGSPMITAGNTVLLPVKTGLTGGFQVEAHAGIDGTLIWSQATDYFLPPHNWIPAFPATITGQNRLVLAAAGGTVHFRNTPDAATGSAGTVAFYGLSRYQSHKHIFDQTVFIDTPITSDSAGNLYFGFTVTGTNPANLTSGIARISASGTGRHVSAATASGDATIDRVAMNAAPALSNDGATIYVAVSRPELNGLRTGYLLALDSGTLARKGKAALVDPASGKLAWVNDDSSASPTVGPDGDVYYGVLERPFPHHNDRGWLLHFDGTLATQKIPGSFGWDATASIVPKTTIPSYAGASPYLIFTKYNNYLGINTGDGHNRIAVLDPDASQKDAFGNTQVMAEVQTILQPVQFPGAPTGAVYEWCINSGVVDPTSGTVIANAEDGTLYRWNLATNALDQSTALNAPRPEAYTPSIIGPDGTVYAINNATLYAIGQ